MVVCNYQKYFIGQCIYFFQCIKDTINEKKYSDCIVAVTLTSCKDEKKVEPTTGTEEVAKSAEASAFKASASSDLPKFSTPEVQKFADEYSAFINESIDAAKSGDAAKIQELTVKSQEWVTKSQAVMAKMTPEDAKLWSEYYAKLSQQMMSR